MALSTDPLDLALDDDGDLEVTTDVRFVAGAEGVAQQVEIAVGYFRGEIFDDLSEGVPWLPSVTVPESRAILGSRYNEARTRADVSNEILAVEHVASIDNTDITRDASARTATIDFRATAVFDDTTTTVEGEVAI